MSFIKFLTPRRLTRASGLALALVGMRSIALHGATIVWTNVAGGDWHQPTNWSPNSVPGRADTAVVNNAGSYTILLSADVDVERLDLGADGGEGRQTLSPGTFRFNLKASALIHRQGTWNVSVGSQYQGSLTVSEGGELNFTNTGTYTLFGGLTNEGTVVVGAPTGPATLYGFGPAAIHNRGLWVFPSDQNASFINADGVAGKGFLNPGTLRQTGRGTVSWDWPFTTTGMLNQTAGLLDVQVWRGTNLLHGTAVFSGLGGIESGVTVADASVISVRAGPILGAVQVLAGGTLNFTNATQYAFRGALDNSGIVVVGNATATTTLYGYEGGVIRNAGLWVIQSERNPSIINAQIGAERLFLNTGVLRESGGGNVSIDWPFTTTGHIEQAGGTLDVQNWRDANVLRDAVTLSGSVGSPGAAVSFSDAAIVSARAGPLAGSLSIGTGAKLNLTNATTYSLRGPLVNFGTVVMGHPTASTTLYGLDVAQIRNEGLWLFQSRQNPAIVNAQVSDVRSFLNLGTLRQTGGGTVSVDWPFTTSGGIDQVGGALNVANWRGTNFLRDPVVITDLLGSSGTSLILTNHAVVSLRAGALRGDLVVAAGASLQFTNATQYSLYGTLVNHGTTLLGSPQGAVTLYGWAESQIANDGLWMVESAQNSSIINAEIRPGRAFVNTGTLRQTGGGHLYMDWPFTTTGRIDQAGGLLDATAWRGTSVLSDSVVLGTLGGADATVTLDPGAVVSVATGPLRGALTVTAGATLNFTNAMSGYLYGVITNRGTVVQGSALGGTVLYGWAAAQIYNEGTWALSNGPNSGMLNAELNPNRQFLNSGVFRQSMNGTATVDWPFTTTGTVDIRQGNLSLAGTSIQTAGEIRLRGGSLALGQPLQLLGGRLSGTNIVAGKVVNGAVVSPGVQGAGRLTIQGDYQQSATGRLVLELGGTTAGESYDRLAVNGLATLDGKIEVALLDPYLPTPGDAFRVITFSSFTGDFASYGGLGLTTNLALQSTLLGPGLDLLAVSTPTAVVPPVIVSQPVSQTVVNGEDAAFFATATGTRPLVYQWQFRGTNLPGANQSSLIQPNVQTNRSGPYQLIVANSGGSVTSAVVVLNVRPVADLVVAEISHVSDAVAGQPLVLSWRTRNQGSQTAEAPWSENLALSTNESGVPAIPLANISINTSLAAGQTTVRTQSVILPGGLDGIYHVVITTDSADQVREEIHEDNNTSVGALSLRIRSPDLQPIQLSAAGSTPFGKSLPVSWVITNAGSATVTSPWNDRLYLSSAPNSLADALPLTTVAISQSLPNGGKPVTNRTTVVVPLAADRPPGSYFLILAVDDDYAIAETSEVNNLLSLQLALTLPPLPDLIAGNVLAPATAAFGDPLALRWSITNQGTLTVDGSWSETVSVATNGLGGSALEVGTFSFTNTLAPGAFLTRTQTVVLPSGVPLGNVWFSVLVDSRNEIFETVETNNSAVAAAPTLIPAVLKLQLSGLEIREGSAFPLQATVTRNGSLEAPLPVTFINDRTDELVVPTGGLLAAGQASLTVNLAALPDGRVDGSQRVTLEVSAEGFTPATATVTVLDADRPRLSVSFAAIEASEGGRLRATVSRDVALPEAVTLSLASASPRRLLPPGTVTIGAGASVVSFDLLAPDDVLIESDALLALTASAPGYLEGSASVTVRDDDLPQLVLYVANGTVSEGAGPQATVATVQRSPVTSQSLTLELESSRVDSVQVPNRVTIPAGASAISFPVATVDNDAVDGAREVRLQAWILASGTGVRLAKGPSTVLTVTDDDGPTLKLSVADPVVAEGLNPATMGRVSRNVGTNVALVVNLTSSATGEASVPAQVTIPAGASVAEFPVVSAADGVANGNVPVTLIATASGFTSGTAQLVVSDVNRPDLVVASISAPATAETESFVNLGYQIRNQGLAAMGSNTLTQRIYLSRDPLVGGDMLVGTYTFSGGLPVGAQFGQTFSIRLPQAAGDYWVIVETDALGVVSEVLENNNTRISQSPIRVTAAYTATVATALNTAPAGTAIPFTGRAVKPGTTTPVPFVLVNLHLHVRGTHRVIAALTDAFGNFSIRWQPLPGEAGFYEIGAAHPGDADASSLDSFALYGLAALPSSPSLTLRGATNASGVIDILNAGDLPIHALSVQVLDAPANLPITVALTADTLAGLATNQLNYTLTSSGTSVGGVNFRVRVTSAEGATLEIPFAVNLESLIPRISVLPTPLVRGMLRGQQTFVSFSVTNSGGAASGPIQVSLPPIQWLRLNTFSPLASLAPGEGTTVSLQLTPPGDLPLTSVSGNLALSLDGQVVGVPFEFRPLSASKGDLRISAVDEFTYFGEGAPKLTQAVAVVRDAVSGAVITNGVTGPNGEWSVAQLPEGYYEIEVTSEKHAAYKGNHFLAAGVTNEVSAFMSRQTVRYKWTVVPTEIEDRYRIVVETEFETNVPAPVVTIEPSVIDLVDLGDEPLQVDLTISNHGLIAAQDFELQFDEHPGVQFEPLIQRLGILPARSTFTIPLVIRRVGPPVVSNRAAKKASGLLQRLGACVAGARGVDQFQCGGLPVVQVTTISFPNAGDCLPAIRLPQFGWLPGGGGTGRPPPPFIREGWPPQPGIGYKAGTPGKSALGHLVDLILAAIYQATPVLAIPSLCDSECQAKLVPALLKCFDAPVPEDDKPDECPAGLKNCARQLLSGLFHGGISDATAVDCIASGITCGVDHGLKKFPLLQCVQDILSACAPEGEASSVSPASRRNAHPLAISGPYAGLLGTLQRRVDRVLAVQSHFAFLYGDAAWADADDPRQVQAFLGKFTAAISAGSVSGAMVSAGELANLLSQPLPGGITVAHVNHLVERWNRSVTYWRAGIFLLSQVPAGSSTDFLALDEVDRFAGLAATALSESAAEGFTSLEAGINAAKADLVTELSIGSGGTCAKLKLRLDQNAVLSRDAFKATLEIDNQEGLPLENIRVTLGVLDSAGNDASARFAIQAPEFTRINGTNGNGHLPTGQAGEIAWTLIPTTDAAPETATRYFVSGGLHYGVNGTAIALPLSPTEITVHPSPRLTVQYFHQRDVFSDDPHTTVIEPSIPFSLGLLVKNQGFGTARNFRITSAQPQIVDNEKGLLADFRIIATEVAGESLTPTLTADFGDLGPGTNAVARWLLTSTIQGLFIDYHATFEHLTGLGNAKLSLVDAVSIHELNHVVQAGGSFEDGRPDFLVNDVPDIHDYPDTLYLSDGSTNRVTMVTNAVFVGTLSPSQLQLPLTVPSPGGWMYLRVADPANGQYRLVGVVRSDQRVLGIDTNAWITDRTFIGLGRRPIRENILHLLDDNSTGSYTLLYEPRPQPDLISPVSAVVALPAESSTGIALQWSGSDDTGVAAYDILVSANGRPFTPWLVDSPQTSALYPGALGNRYAFYSLATDAAGNRELPPGTPDAETTVTRTNRPPVLTPIADLEMVEGQTLFQQVTATDPDGDAVSFVLEPGAPAGAVLDPRTGLLTWVTGEAHGPGTNRFTVLARDSGFPSFTRTTTFQVVVREDNVAPILQPIADRSLNEGQLLIVTNAASDTDLPRQTLTYSLAPGAPLGVVLNPTSGVLTWRPSDTQGGTTNRLGVIVTDDGPGPQRATQTFTVVVRDTRPDFVLSLGGIPVLSGQSAQLPLALHSGLDLTSLTLDLEVDSNRLINLNLQSLASPVASADLRSVGDGRFRLQFRTRPNEFLQGDFVLAQLSFGTVSNQHSAVGHLRGLALAGERPSGTPVPPGRVGDGTVFIVGREPILVPALTTNQQLGLTLYAEPGGTFGLQRREALDETASWTGVGTQLVNSLRTEWPSQLIRPEPAFFRAFRVVTGGLSLHQQGDRVLIEWSADCAECWLEETRSMNPGVTWTPTQTGAQREGKHFRVNVPRAAPNTWYRLVMPVRWRE